MFDNSVPHKTCSCCKKQLPLICFANSKTSKDGLHNYCRKCAAEKKGRIWYPECLMPDGYRQCGKCGECLPYDYFHKNPNNHLGLQNICKACKKIADAKYLDEHREENKEYHKDRYHAKKSEYQQYKKDHADKIAQQKKDWRKNNPDKVKKHKRDNAKRNPQSVRIRANRYAKNHPEKLKANYHKRRARILNADGSFTSADIDRIFEEQEGRCAYCGITLFRDIPGDMHIDHIKPLSRGGSNNPENLACACEACNLSKNDKTLSEWMDTRGW